MKKLLTILLPILLIGAAIFVIVGFNSQPANETPAEIQPQEAETAIPPVSISGIIEAEGEITPLNYVELSFAVPGTIVEIQAAEGEQVESGQVIARLEGKGQAEAEIAAAELELVTAQQALKDLYENAELKHAKALLALAQAEKALDDAETHMQSMEFKEGSEEDIATAYADYILAMEEIENAEEDYANYVNKSQDDWGRANSYAKLAAARDRRNKAWQRYDHLISMPDEFEVAEAEAELAVAEANLQIANMEWDKLQDGLDEDDLALAESRLNAAEARLESAKKRLKDLALHAPFDGLVVKNELEIGELVSPEIPSVILADQTRWQVETTDLTEMEVADIEIGIPVTVTLDAIPEAELTGKVVHIKEYGITKQGDVTYTVTILLDENEYPLRWRMTALVAFE